MSVLCVRSRLKFLQEIAQKCIFRFGEPYNKSLNGETCIEALVVGFVMQQPNREEMGTDEEDIHVFLFIVRILFGCVCFGFSWLFVLYPLFYHTLSIVL